MVYPQPDSLEPGVGFPIARMVAVIDYTTGAVLDLAIGPYSGKETGIFNEKNSTSYYHLLKAIAYKTVGNRPNRLEPRRVKRRPKPFPKLQKARQLYKRLLKC